VQARGHQPGNVRHIGQYHGAHFILIKETEFANKFLQKFLENISFVQLLNRQLQQAGVATPVDRFFIQWFVGPVAAAGLVALLVQMPLVALAGTAVPILAWFVLSFRISGRLSKINTQLPDSLNMMNSALRAGYAFNSALMAVAHEMPEPIATEFRQVSSDISLGIPLKQALSKMVETLDRIPDIRMFATAVIIQRESGGNLAEILEQLADTIRQRYKLKRQISAMTGQAQMTGYVLGCAPIVLLGFLTFFMFDYVAPLYQTLYGQIALGVALVMQIIGFFIMRAIIEIKV
jgi:tight adherence protein B